MHFIISVTRQEQRKVKYATFVQVLFAFLWWCFTEFFLFKFLAVCNLMNVFYYN